MVRFISEKNPLNELNEPKWLNELNETKWYESLNGEFTKSATVKIFSNEEEYKKYQTELNDKNMIVILD